MEAKVKINENKYIQINKIFFSIVNTYESWLNEEKTTRENPLSISEKGIIMVLGQLEPINSRKLSEIMDINPGTISLYVDRLVKKDFVIRTRDSMDRRNWWLNLTEKGKEEYSDSNAGSIKYTSNIISALSKTDQEKLYNLLMKVSKQNGYMW